VHARAARVPEAAAVRASQIDPRAERAPAAERDPRAERDRAAERDPAHVLVADDHRPVTSATSSTWADPAAVARDLAAVPAVALWQAAPLRAARSPAVQLLIS
jgi:hypothetical protein